MEPSEHLHPGRRSIRLKYVNYSAPGFYFVTTCAAANSCIFGTIQTENVALNQLGKVAQRCWEDIPAHFPNATLLEFVVMPNHVHGIAQIVRLRSQAHFQARVARAAARMMPGSLGAIVRSFKAAVTKAARMELHLASEIWQRNYYESVLRPGEELANARAYILENPRRWQWDHENPSAKR